MVRQQRTGVYRDWENAPVPSLVVEVLSGSTRRRDREHKRRYYLEAGVPEYWIVDQKERSICVVRPNTADEVATERLVWSPAGLGESLAIDVAALLV